VVQDRIPVCVCDDGYHPEGLECLEDLDPPLITVVPDPLDFGDLHIRDRASLPLTVRNDGEEVLWIDHIYIDGGMGMFTFLPATLPPLGAGDETILQVSFSPASVGGKEAELELSSDNPDVAAVRVYLTGNGIDPDIFVLPAAPIDLGQVLVGQSREESVYIHKAGTGPLEITGISLTVGTSSDFTLVDVPILPAVMNSAATPMVFKIRYVPSSVGRVNGAVQIDSSDLDASVLFINIIGEGISP
jgi:hypothetical protein